ncbi:MAG TPA: DUF3224 domain-containing protein [Candidatus Sulfotelmatobacter sp.]|nr:DUF3224 domain-containing protein [Candidatus Sulfotelmatobacter sp.]
MKRKNAFSAMLLALGVTLILSMFMSVAFASTPETVNFTSTQTWTILSGTRAGESDNVILDVVVNAIWVGDIAGTSTSDSRWILHYLPTPGAVGTNNLRGVNTVSATVNGKSGTLIILLTASRSPDDVEADGTWVILSGTGDLANLHGQGTAGPSGTPGVTAYTGQIHWDP